MTTLTKPVLDVLRRSSWVHVLGGSVECEGCANDGEEGFCEGAGIAEPTTLVDGIGIEWRIGRGIDADARWMARELAEEIAR